MDADIKAFMESVIVRRLDKIDEKLHALVIQITQMNGRVTANTATIASKPCDAHQNRLITLTERLAEMAGAERVTGERDTEERQVTRTMDSLTRGWVWELAKLVLPLTPWIGLTIYLIQNGGSP